MNHRLLILMIFLLTLAACGGGDRKAPAELTGELQAGNVQGVAYQTPTRAGVTDANGRFTYLPGETVTFSVGGTVLGSAPGSTKITLFTLAGLTPPTTERALRRELDRARRVVTPFTRALNLDRLLLSLDADNNVANGLDVRSGAAALAGISLDPAVLPAAFELACVRAVVVPTRNVPLVRAAGHLYQSIGVRVPVHAEMRNESQYDGGLVGYSHVITYRADGLLESEAADYNGDGAPEYVYTRDYDAMGRQLEFRVERGVNQLQPTPEATSSRAIFDAHGNATGYVYEFDNGTDGTIDVRYVQEVTLDAQGFTTAYATRIDQNGDGVIDSREAGSAEYDANHRALRYLTSADDDLDGIDDYRNLTTFRYDGAGRQVERRYEYDYDADGVADACDVETYEFIAGQPTRLVSTSDYDLDGTIDYQTIQSWTYDRRGNVLTGRSDTDVGGDRVTDRVNTFVRTYDADARVLSDIRDEDMNADGTFESRNSTVTTYDDIGNTAFVVNDFFQNGGTEVLARLTEGSEFGSGGETLVTVSHYDANGDGLTDIRSETVNTHAVVEDGVMLLAQWYFSRL